MKFRFCETFALVLSVAFAASANADNLPFKIGSHTSRFIQTYTGINYLTSKTTGFVLGLVLRHEFGGKAKAKVETFSFTDLLAGKIKSVDVSLVSPSFNDVELGQIHVVTKTPLWYQWHKSHRYKKGLQNALFAEINGSFTEKNVSGALASPKILSVLHMIKLNLPGLGQQQLQLLTPKVALEKNKVVISTSLITACASPDTGVFVTLSGNPCISGSKILLEDLQLSSPNISNPADFAMFTQNLLNPLVDLGKFDRKDHAFRLTSMQLDEGVCNISGNLVMAPRK